MIKKRKTRKNSEQEKEEKERGRKETMQGKRIYQGTYASGYGRGSFVLYVHGESADLEWDHDEKSGKFKKTNKNILFFLFIIIYFCAQIYV